MVAETDQPGRFIAETTKVLSTFRTKAPSTAALASARKASINSFVFNFASKAAQLQRLASYKLVGLPANFVYEYKEGLDRVDG